MKKLLISAMLAVFTLACFAQEASEKRVINIYSWNDDVKNRIETYCKSRLPENIDIEYTVYSNSDGSYQNNIDTILRAQADGKSDKKIDIFMVDEDIASKYLNTPLTLDLINDVGLTKEDLAEQFQYIIDLGTDETGVLKAVSWQGCPGGFVYRRSYAKKVLKTDDPVEVQKALSTWTAFDDVAKKMKKAGFAMVTGFDDTLRVFRDNISAPLVDKTNKIVIDDSIKAWVKQSKEYTSKKYNLKAYAWTNEYFAGMGKNGKVFGYFVPGWFLEYIFAPNTAGSSGDWGFCKGPQGYLYGGVWLCAAKGSENLDVVKEILKVFTCNSEVQSEIALGCNEFANNMDAMKKLSASEQCSKEVLNGQNYYQAFTDSALSFRKQHTTIYDKAILDKLLSVMPAYFEGRISEKDAWEDFYNSITQEYPQLWR